MTDSHDQRGFALIAVLVVLGVLLALVGPFLMSMSQESRGAYDEASQREVEMLVDAARKTALQRIGGSQGSLDITPGADSLDEFRESLRLAPRGEDSPLGDRRVVSGEVEDMQGRLHAPTLPPLVWGSLLDLRAVLSKDLEADSEEIEATGIGGFPDAGFLWIDNELIRYGRKTPQGFEDLERGYKWAGGPPDPFGPAAKHRAPIMIFDARCRSLVTAQFDGGGQQARASFRPWRSLSALPDVSRADLGVLTMEDVEPLRPVLSFDAARPQGSALGPKERVFNSLVPGESLVLTVRDAASFPSGSIVRIESDGQFEWALVVRHTVRGGRNSSVDGRMWNLVLHRVTQLAAEEGEAFVQPLQPVPLNVNTASERVLTVAIEGVRARPEASGPRGHTVMRLPLSRSKARAIAERIVAQRGPNDEEQREHAFEGFEDLFTRVLKPMVDGGELPLRELEYVYALMMNGRQAKLDQAGIPLCFESAGLVRYRIAAAVRSGAGATLAVRERSGVAFAQPDSAVDRFYTSQADFDEATRLDRSRKFWSTAPLNTTMRLGATAGDPPDMSLPHLLQYFHGKAAQFPSKEPESSRFSLGIARAPRFGDGSAVYSFETESNPEGWDARKQGPYKSIKAFLAAPAKGKSRRRAARDGQSIPMYEGEQGLGIAFGWSAWFRPRSLGNQMLFDLASQERSPIQNRIFAALEDNQIVLRVFDAAGLDPDPGAYNPTETCLKWTVPIQGTGVQANLWTHVGFEIAGGTADGVVLFTDGAALGRPSYVSYLGLEVPEFDPTQSQGVGNDKSWNPTLGIEDGSDLPQQCVVIVGNELFEVTGVEGQALITARNDSRGGRMARQDLFEYSQGSGNQIKVSLPRHPANSGVRLYGYSNPIREDQVVIPGEGRLSDEIGAWGAAKVVGPEKPINLGPISVGTGIDEKYLGKIELATPQVNAKSGKDGVPGFDRNGGYALLLQDDWRITRPVPDVLGGIEVIRYSGFDGSSITIEERALTLAPDLDAKGKRNGAFADEPRKFVAEWAKGLFQKVDANELPQMFLYCVPISVSVAGLTLIDPSDKGHSEWIQIYEPGNEANTEWVRYDFFDAARNWVCRTRWRAVNNLYWILTQRGARGEVQEIDMGGGRVRYVWPPLPGPANFIAPPKVDPDEIGHADEFEFGDNLPHYEARMRFGFRGDPGVRTSSHPHGANSIVTPVFRTALGSVTLGRPGRNDRVALVSGATGQNAPLVEWHTVNWCVRNWEVFNQNRNNGPTPPGRGPRLPGRGNNNQNSSPDSRGPRGNLVALKKGVGAPYSGSKLVDDHRLLDRLVKFPSGELPMRLSNPVVAGSDIGDLPNFDGIVDDIQGYWGMHHNQRSGGTDVEILGVVGVPCTESDQTISIVPARRQRQGSGQVRGGGLLLCEGEVIGFARIDTVAGAIEVAAGGRGLLGTEARAHDRGARLQFISCRPATTLTSGLPANAAGFMVENPAKLPRNAGTVLVGQELMHYTWTRGQLFEMPAHAERPQGLFRGRYGTTPAAHGANEMAIYWPMRYWDRYELRADDPEVAYFGISTEMPNLYVTELTWEEQIPEPTLDIVLLARADERVPWSADPETTFGLWRFDGPTGKDGKGLPRIMAQASRWDFRFHVRYLPGAFNAQLFNATAWKRTPVVKNFVYSYQASSNILSDTETLR